MHTVAGVGGSLTLQLLYPFDVLKTRFQSHDSGKDEHNAVPRYRSVMSSFKDMVKQEGFFSMFKGVSINIVAGTVSYGTFFYLYETFKQRLPSDEYSEFTSSLIASTQAAAISSAMMQPVWVLKTRRILDMEKGNDLKRSKVLVKSVYKEHGLKGFYRGYLLSLGLGLYGTIQLTAYSTFKDMIEKAKEGQEISNSEIAGLGMVARFCASIVLHPLTTVRTRFQQTQFYQGIDGQKYSSIRDTVVKTYKGEGVKGFYKGIVPMTLRALPSQGLFFLVYENTKKYMSGRLNIPYPEPEDLQQYFREQEALDSK